MFLKSATFTPQYITNHFAPFVKKTSGYIFTPKFTYQLYTDVVHFQC